MVMNMPSAPQDWPLPPLRDDLHILRGTPTPDGVPTWNILDPVRHQYFQIGWAAFQMLSQWQVGMAKQLVSQVSGTTTAKVTLADVRYCFDPGALFVPAMYWPPGVTFAWSATSVVFSALLPVPTP